jgi:hypothetical protein
MAKPAVPRELPITLKLPSFLLRDIGRIITHHSVLESKLSRIVYTLLGIDPVAVREPRTTDRLEMIVDLLKLKGISVSADLDGIREALELCAK